MLRLSPDSSLWNSGHLLLNVIRACTIVALVCISASSWVMVVMTDKNTAFFFFDAVSQIFASTISMFLIVSEIGIFRKFYATTWPVFSPRHGLTWLGSATAMISCHVLGSLNNESLSQDAIGMPLWRLIMASGVLGLLFGVINIVASILFQDRDNDINARNIRSDGTLAGVTPAPYAGSYASSARTGNSVQREKLSAAKRWTQRFSPFKGGARPNISPPIPQTYNNNDIEIPSPPTPPPMQQQQYDYYSDLEAQAGSRYGESDIRSTVMTDITRPETALHPLNTTQAGVSRYSVASHVRQF